MIDRYTLPKMGSIWSDENKFNTWLKVEILACEALAKQGKVPLKDLQIIKQKAKFSIPRINEIEKEVHHDVIGNVLKCLEK